MGGRKTLPIATPRAILVSTQKANGGSSSEKLRITSAGNVGIGTTTPGSKLHALATTEQLRLGFDFDSYASLIIDTNGDLKIDTTGTTVSFPIKT